MYYVLTFYCKKLRIKCHAYSDQETYAYNLKSRSIISSDKAERGAYLLVNRVNRKRLTTFNVTVNIKKRSDPPVLVY